MNGLNAMISVIITAGGIGRRFGGELAKQFVTLNGRPLIYHTIDAFSDHPLVQEIIVSLSEREFDFHSKQIDEEFFNLNLKFVKGGRTRQESVFNALQNCSKDCELCAIHDAVRPFVRHAEITVLAEKAAQYGAAIPVSRVKYTIKEIQGSLVKQTLNRDSIVSVHTPQIFILEKILKYHSLAKKESKIFTDDAGIFEFYNQPVFVVEVPETNIKITEPFDLEIAKLIMKNFIK
ncbi:MAG: 2-C-methyl-D-erythritol 4-phosphate cytidylyltransferase [Candidatus Cloacimonetes bacterium]|nr:2-C-methyl-D-erythritol 4-phosphate cytidylyltransferase [Candidatus Cloacimonadota bacterium]